MNSRVGAAAKPCCQTLPRLLNGVLLMPSFAAASSFTALRTSARVVESWRGLLLSASRRNSLSPATGSNIYVTLEGSVGAERCSGNVPSSRREPLRCQGAGIGMVRVVTPYAAGMITYVLLLLSRHPAGLRPERRKRMVRLSQLWFWAPRANQVSVGYSVRQHGEFRHVGRCTDRPGQTLLIVRCHQRCELSARRG